MQLEGSAVVNEDLESPPTPDLTYTTESSDELDVDPDSAMLCVDTPLAESPTLTLSNDAYRRHNLQLHAEMDKLRAEMDTPVEEVIEAMQHLDSPQDLLMEIPRMIRTSTQKTSTIVEELYRHRVWIPLGSPSNTQHGPGSSVKAAPDVFVEVQDSLKRAASI